MLANDLQDKFEDAVLRGCGDDRAHQAAVPGGPDGGRAGHRPRDRGARHPRQLEDRPLRGGTGISSPLRSGKQPEIQLGSFSNLRGNTVFQVVLGRMG